MQVFEVVGVCNRISTANYGFTLIMARLSGPAIHLYLFLRYLGILF